MKKKKNNTKTKTTAKWLPNYSSNIKLIHIYVNISIDLLKAKMP